MRKQRTLLLVASTRNQTPKRTKINYDSFFNMYAFAMRENGVTVEHRPYIAGEKLSRYDRVVVGLTNVLSYGAHYCLTALEAMSRASETQLRLMTDDWSVRQMETSWEGAHRKPEYIFKELFPREAREDVDRDRIAASIKYLATAEEIPVLTSMVDGGHRQVARRVRVVGVDPTAMQPRYPVGLHYKLRKRRVIFAALNKGQHDWFDRKFKTSMDVLKFSGKKGWITEEELVGQYYASSYAVVAAPYYHAGSGWWRARYRHCADTGTILLTDPREASVLGPSYAVTAQEFEQMTTSELQELAERQRADQELREWSAEKFIRRCEEFTFG